MLKLSSVFVTLLLFSLLLFASIGNAQENPYAIETKVIKNEQAIQTLRQQQANLYLKMEDLLVKYGELLGKIQDMSHRLDAIEARLNSLASQSGGPQKFNSVTNNTPYSNSLNQTNSGNIPPANKLPVMTKSKNNNSANQVGNRIQKKTTLPNKNPITHTKTAAKQLQNIKQQKPTVANDVKAYLAAKKLYDAKRYRAAINAFNNFKREFKGSRYLPDAIFYLAQSHFNLGEYDKAIISYDYLINTYPKSNKVPTALLKEGISFIKLGDTIDGKYLLKKTISSYPHSKEAQTAKKYLSKIK